MIFLFKKKQNEVHFTGVRNLKKKKMRGNKQSIANPFLLVYKHHSHLWRCVVEYTGGRENVIVRYKRTRPPFFFEDGYENGCCGERIM